MAARAKKKFWRSDLLAQSECTIEIWSTLTYTEFDCDWFQRWRPVSSVGKAPDCCAGGCRFKPRPDQLRRKCCLCNDICTWLDFQDLSDKLRTINRRPHLTVLVWDVKEPVHCSKGVGDVVPGVLVYHLFCSGGACVSYYSL